MRRNSDSSVFLRKFLEDNETECISAMCDDWEEAMGEEFAQIQHLKNKTPMYILGLAAEYKL
jgi:hypothetical protein